MASVTAPVLTAKLQCLQADAAGRAQAPAAIGDELNRALVRFAAFNLAEGSIQLNLHSAGLALARAASRSHVVDPATLASLVIGLVVGAWNLAKEHAKMELLTGLLQKTGPGILTEMRQYLRDVGLRDDLAEVFVDAWAVGDWEREDVWATV